MRSRSLRLLIVAVALGVHASVDAEPIALFQSVVVDRPGEVIRATMDPAAMADWQATATAREVFIPLPDGRMAKAILAPFEVIGPNARFVMMTPVGEVEMPRPRVTLYRGTIADVHPSSVFLALTSDGTSKGMIDLAGERFYVSSESVSGQRSTTELTIHKPAELGDGSEAPAFCGVDSTPIKHVEIGALRGSPPNNQGPRLAHVAIEADQFFVNLFSSAGDCNTYVVQLLAAIADIYMRDLNVRLSLDFVRLWPAGGEPFSADSLSGFATYWINNEDPTPYNFIHMLSGTRATSYAGIAYLGGTCDLERTYGISGFLNGSFASPVGAPTFMNWDIIVPAHEMGHNAGTGHTHDSYTPPIDTCGTTPTTPLRGSIMSYCHTTSGGTWNTDMWMHRRVEDVIDANFASGGCYLHDCNGNQLADEDEILANPALDANGDGVPDSCQDCNNNSILDPIDLLNGAPDVNGNGVIDTCEPDCNGNGTPDPYECGLNPAIDANGNNVPDSCEPDCNNNGTADWVDTNSLATPDVDRNTIPDSCQDCNANGVSDWLDMGRGENIYIGDRADFVREYFRTSGWPIQSLGSGTVLDPYDCVFGSDRLLYVASYGDDRIVRINPDTGVASTFVTAASGSLDGPSSLVFGPNGNLFVASRLNSRVLQYNGTTGAFVNTFVAAGLGGLSQPYGLTFGPDGHLYVASGNNTIIRYNGATGALIGTFVAAGSGGLNSPRGMAFMTSGNLLVASFSSNNILEYDGATGAFVRVFNGPYVMNGVWGLRLAPNGNIWAMRTSSSIRLIEFRQSDGILIRSIVRSDALLATPTGFAIRPGFVGDCNGNKILDGCEPESSDLDLFVSELLASPQNPAYLCLLDQNADGSLDGDDIAGFVTKLLGL
ncbi:MAG: hypothetical protein HZA51_17800 [Planctomycetes bacterium]|nr:hypothetical protein [Planctomycetota bacterium]